MNALTVVEIISNRQPDQRWWRLQFRCPRSGRDKKVATYDRDKVLDGITNFRGPVLFYIWDKRRGQ